jgi:short-subunit dehydrogenase
MRVRGKERILVTGSIAGFMPGTDQAVYNGTKAFIDSFSFALRAELKRLWGHRHLPHAGSDRDRFL